MQSRAAEAAVAAAVCTFIQARDKEDEDVVVAAGHAKERHASLHGMQASMWSAGRT